MEFRKTKHFQETQERLWKSVVSHIVLRFEKNTSYFHLDLFLFYSKSKIKKIGLTNKRKRSKQENKHGVPIDALLFFERRARVKEQDSAILVSSQDGVLELWSMFGPLRPRGTCVKYLQFYCRGNKSIHSWLGKKISICFKPS